jgi:putative transposase
VDLPEGSQIAPTEFIGVDFGVVNLATDNDGDVYTNTETEKVRQKQNKVRRSLGRRAGKVKREGSRPKN